MPWKNGLGTTAEIAIDPPGADLGSRFRWRLSIATVQGSGPFSTFSGYERTIMLIEGRGMDLAVGSASPRRLDRPFEPFVFPGDAPVECSLIDGPVRDFNLMVDRSLLHSHTEVWQLGSLPRAIAPSPGDRIVHCFDGTIDLTMDAARWSCRLGPDDTAIVPRGEPGNSGGQMSAVASGRATIAVIVLTVRADIKTP